jgi:hypothetical protein
LAQTSYDYVLIRYSELADALGMATLEEKIKVETQVRELLAQYGLPEPDAVEYGYTCIRLFFDEPKTVLVVDIDGPNAQDDHDDESSGVDVTDPEDDRGGRPLDGFGREHGAGLN